MGFEMGGGNDVVLLLQVAEDVHFTGDVVRAAGCEHLLALLLLYYNRDQILISNYPSCSSSHSLPSGIASS